MVVMFTLWLVCCHVFVVVRSNYQACCLCDDYLHTSDLRCDNDCGTTNGMYAFTADVCQTRRQFDGGKWHVTRSTTDFKECSLNLEHSYSTPGCLYDQPAEGTICYTCCMDDGHDAFHCVDNPDTIHGNFPTVSSISVTTIKELTKTTLPTTTSTTATTTQTTSASPSTVLTSPATTVLPTQRVSCETCLSGNCTHPKTLQCRNDEHYCMNTVFSDGLTINIQKVCATEMECYYGSYLGNKHEPQCTAVTGSAGSQSYVHECSYCCDAHASACNTNLIPQHQTIFHQPHSGSVCETGRGSSFTRTTCDRQTPYCMNTVVKSAGVSIVTKTCESEVLCNLEWWKTTRNNKACLHTDVSGLPTLDDGLVCHYCCRSEDGQPCNTETIPSDVQTVIARAVDGGWSRWTPWRGCSHDCTGVLVRFRTCTDPVPGIYGNNCFGQATEQETCDLNVNCKINGTYAPTIIG